MTTPCYWIHLHDGPVRCRWDEQMLDRLISGRLKRPGWFPDVVHYETMEAFRRNPVTESCIVMFPAGDHDERDLSRLNADLGRHRNPVIFVTSDEGSTFPVDRIVHPTATFFVMTPRSDHVYPPETFFIGEGDADAGILVEPDPTLEKGIDVFFMGQGGHPRREQMLSAFDAWHTAPTGFDSLYAAVETTPGFLKGVSREHYLQLMAGSKVALCPAGTKTQDSFRVYEALTHGCVPVLDAVRNDGEAPHFWEMLGDHLPVKTAVATEWDTELASCISYALDDWPKSAVRAHEWWHWHRRRLALHLSASLMDLSDPPSVHEQITVVMPTSPIPSHPSTAIIESTINSIRRYLDCEILVMVDGVRPEQADREADYWEYVRRLMLVAERADNVTPIVSWTHKHQSGLLRTALDHVTTPFVFFVEHDTPLDGQPIDFEGILTAMNTHGLNLMRFHHESHVLDEHVDLFFETEPDPNRAGAPYVRTMQWSQRPHIARCSFYDRLLRDFFGDGAKTMIEDVLHGVGEFAHRKQPPEDWGMAVFAPSEGGMRRSLHLDGRDDAPRYEMTYDYPRGRPPGAPRPGTR